MTELPAPLVSVDVDLSGFSSFMLDVDRLLASELVAIGTPEECWAAVLLWCRAWKQKPAGSLPDDERVLAAFSASGKRWPKIRAMALRGFVKCSDGRLYHRVLAAEANEAWARRKRFKDRSAKANEKRWSERAESQGGEEHQEGTGEEPLNHPSKRASGIQEAVQQGSLEGVQEASSTPPSRPRQDRTGQDSRIIPTRPTEPRGAPDDPSNRFDEVLRACSEALGTQAPADPVIGPMILLIDRGAKLTEVLTALRSEAQRPRRKPIRTWSLWAEIVTSRLAEAPQAALLKPAKVDDPNDPSVAVNDHAMWPESLCRRIADEYDRTGRWPSGIGPEPGRPGCRFPDHVLPERFRQPAEAGALH